MRMKMAFAVIVGGLLIGCAETPRQPEMRPIPPPPPTPPPGYAYVPQTVVVTNSPPPTVSVAPAGTNSFEVSSNFVASGQTPAITATPGQVVQSAPPQYEVVPPRPGPDYVWRDGRWQWNNGWVWMPGEWIYRGGPPVIIVEPGFYYGRRHYYYRRW